MQIQWLRDGAEIPGAGSSTLTLDPLETNDSGKYSAVITNAVGDTRSVEVLITVANAAPRLTGDFEVQADNRVWPGEVVLIEGDYLFIGSPYETSSHGVVHVFLKDASQSSGWREVQEIPAPILPGVRQGFGQSLAAYEDTLVVGTQILNNAYVYERSEQGNWELVQTISQPGGDGIGFSRALDMDERTLVIGAEQANELGGNSGAVFIYERSSTSGQWEEIDMLTAGIEQDNLGSKVAVDGDTIVAAAIGIDTPPGGTNSGGAYIFQRTNEAPGSSWTLVRKLQPTGLQGHDRFGFSVDIDGDTAVVGAPSASIGVERAGAVFVFDRNAGGANRWSETARVLHRGRRFADYFGTDVQIRRNRLFASFVNDDLTNSRNGSIFIYDRQGAGSGVWAEFAELNESPRNQRREFGYALGVSGTQLVVSAKKDTNNSEGVLSRFYFYDIPPADNSAPVFGGEDPGSAIPGELFNYEILTTESDGQPVTIGAAFLPGWLRLIDRGDGTALLTGLPSTDDFGSHLVRILASDGLIDGISMLEFNLEVVNTPPIVIGFDPLEVDEDSPDVSIDLFAGFTDAEYPDSELRFEIVSEIPAALLERTAINPADGMLNIGFVPDANGQAEIVIRATDPGDLSATTTLAITVLPVNDRPVSIPGAPITANGSAAPETVAAGDLFSDIDEGDVLTFSIVGNTAPAIFDSVSIDAQSGALQIAFADYVDGESTLTIRATDIGSLFVDSEITVTLPPIPKPQITPDVSMSLNRRTGLYEQQITITNNSGRPMAAFQLIISNLNEGVSVYNGSGTNASGASLVDHLAIIPPGASVTTNIEYFSKLRTAPGDPGFDAVPKLPTPNVAPPGRVFEIDRVEVLPEGFLIEFPAEPGKSYAIQYAHNTTWFTSPMVVRAAGSRVQWIDSGSPKTPSPPSTVVRRLYRIIELSD